MAGLIAAALFWLLIHLGLAGSSLRGRMVARIGDNGFRGLFSLLSAIGLAALIMGFGAARAGNDVLLWSAPDWCRWIPIIGMPAALLLFVGSVSVPNPGLVGADRLLAAPEPARGMLRITRHPMLIAFALWAALHIPASGDLAGLLLFLAILVVAIAGTFSIDRKRAASMPRDWPRYAAATSILPFAAIVQGRNRLVWAEIGWWRIAVALLAWMILLYLHGTIVGVSALPF